MTVLNINFSTSKLLIMASVIVLLILLIPRFLLLDQLPNGLNWDEAAYGYNAFSLLKTGRDEWGVKWPLFLRSFGDYKPALLSYFQVPFIALFGLSASATRLPVVLISLIGLGSWYSIAWHFSHSKLTSLLATLIMASTPWHFHYSRAAMDPILGFSFLLLGLALYVRPYPKERYIGIFWLVVSAYCYNSTRAFVPMLLILDFLFRISQKGGSLSKRCLNSFKFELLSIFLSLFVLIVLQLSQAGSRAQAVFFFSKPEIQAQVNESIYRSNVLNHPFPSLYSNKIINITTTFIHHYLTHFDPIFLFFNRQISPRHGFSVHGNLLLVTLPFLILGIIRSNTSDDRFFLWWLIISPVIAAVTDDVPHSGRVIIMLAPFSYLIAKGILHLVNHWLSMKTALLIVSVTAITLNFCFYLTDYLKFYPEESYTSWQGDVRDLFAQIDHINDYERVYIGVPSQNIYIFDAFYHQIAPEVIQQTHHSGDTNHRLLNRYFGRYHLCNLLADSNQRLLIVGDQPLILSIAQNEVEGQLYKHTLPFFNRFHQSKDLYYFHDSDLLSDWQRSALIQECDALTKAAQ